MPNYISIIATCFPASQAYTTGNPFNYNELIWVTTPVSQATLDTSACVITEETEIVALLPADLIIPNGSILVWNSTTQRFVVANHVHTLEGLSNVLDGITPQNNWSLRYDQTLSQWKAVMDQAPPLPNTQYIIQTVDGRIPAVSGTSIFPRDNTVPLITSGTNVISRVFVPTLTSSKVRITGNATISSSHPNMEVLFVVFRDSVCVGSVIGSVAHNDIADSISFEFYDIPNTTSAITYSIRVGKTTRHGVWHTNALNSNVLYGNTLTANSYSFTEIGIVT